MSWVSRGVGGVLLGFTVASAAPPYAWKLPPGFPPPPVPKSNPMSAAKVELGRQLFLDSRLSGNGTQSCASCHRPDQAFTDGRSRALGSTGETHRRGVPSLANVGYRRPLTWASKSHQSLEAQARVPLFGRDPVEMGATPGGLERRLRGDAATVERFAVAFPDTPQPVTVENITKALASYQRTLFAGNSAYDRALFEDDATALSPGAWRGMTLFFSARAGCSGCHGGLDFSTAESPGFFRTGPVDPHDSGLARETQAKEDAGRFRPPSLRNVALTAPYMHDGGMATLEDVIAHYVAGDAPDLEPFPLTELERRDLIQFLENLTDAAPARRPTPATEP